MAISDEARLRLYNRALLILGERRLKNLTDSGKARAVLDTIWEQQALEFLLELDFWRFSLITKGLTADQSTRMAFGFQFKFDLPEDYVKLYTASTDEYSRRALRHYHHEGNRIFSDCDEIYLRYVSSERGSDTSLWSKAFERVAEAYLAREAVTEIKTAKDMPRVEAIYDKRLKDAEALDAFESPPGRIPDGSWIGSRRSRLSSGSIDERYGRY